MKTKVVISSMFTEFWESVGRQLTLLESAESGNTLADLYGVQLPNIKLRDGREYQSVQLKYTRFHKPITLLRFLTSKLVTHPKTVERLDILLIYEQILTCQDIAIREEGFRNKFGSALEALAKIMKGFRLKRTTTNFDIEKLAAQVKGAIPNFLFPERNLKQISERCSKMWYVTTVQPTGREVKRLPPKAYIGKGYTDKGTAKDPAFDGSPAWQTVAATFQTGDEDET